MILNNNSYYFKREDGLILCLPNDALNARIENAAIEWSRGEEQLVKDVSTYANVRPEVVRAALDNLSVVDTLPSEAYYREDGFLHEIIRITSQVAFEQLRTPHSNIEVYAIHIAYPRAKAWLTQDDSQERLASEYEQQQRMKVDALLSMSFEDIWTAARMKLKG